MKLSLKMLCPALLLLSSCSNEEKSEEDPYHDMVMQEEEEVEWTTGQEGNPIAGELTPEPQEKTILDPALLQLDAVR